MLSRLFTDVMAFFSMQLSGSFLANPVLVLIHILLPIAYLVFLKAWLCRKRKHWPENCRIVSENSEQPLSVWAVTTEIIVFCLISFFFMRCFGWL